MDNRSLCLDTSILIAFLRNREPGASTVVQAVQQYQCGVTAINSYELLFGIHRSGKDIGENALLGPLQVWPFDKQAAEQAAQLHADLIARNQDIGVKDVLIAAVCLVHDLPILTLNAKHFERVPSLTVYTPSTLPA